MSERALHLAAIRERDAATADSWFEDEMPVDLVARAIQDRRWLLETIDAQQAHIDALMLEYCPDEMTPEQKATWAAAQSAVS